MIKILFLDIDGTLIFLEDCLKCVKIQKENYFIHKTTQKLLENIKEIIPIVLISGRRESSYFRIKRIIPHNIAILEHGGLIYNNDLISSQWEKTLNHFYCKNQKNLWDFANKLINKGFYIDKKGRKFSFRIQLTKNNKILSKNAEDIISEYLPSSLKIIKNEGMIDVIPINSGKLNIASLFLRKNKMNMDDVVFIGNDENDVDFLSAAGKAMTFQNSSEEVILSVKTKGSNGVIVSKGHNGIINALKKIKKELIN